MRKVRRLLAVLGVLLLTGMAAGGLWLALRLPDTLTGHQGSVVGVAFSPDGQWLASASTDDTLRLWRMSDRRLVRVIQVPGGSGGVTSVAFAPDSQTLAAGYVDQQVRLWRAADGSLVRSFSGHTKSVQAVVFTPDGQQIVSASWDGTVRVWQPTTGMTVLTIQAKIGQLSSVAIAPNGQIVAAGGEGGHVGFWRLDTGLLAVSTINPLYSFDLSPPQTNIAFAPDGQLLASAAPAYKGSLTFWRVADGQYMLNFSIPDSPLRAFAGAEDTISVVAYTPDGQFVITNRDEQLWLWRPLSDTRLLSFTGHSRDVRSLAVSPDGHTLASGSDDTTIRLWTIPPLPPALSPRPAGPTLTPTP